MKSVDGQLRGSNVHIFLCNACPTIYYRSRDRKSIMRMYTYAQIER